MLRFGAIAGIVAAACLLADTTPVLAQTRSFNIPAGDINRALPMFAKQSGIQIIVSADHLVGVRSSAIIGSYDIREALRRLIGKADLEIATDSGALIILRPRRARPRKQVLRQTEPETVRRSAPRPDIVVTGSLIARQGLSQASTVTRIDRLQLDANSSPSLESSFNLLPQFTPGQTAFATHFAATGLSTLNMRGLGAQRNLVLLDGRRLQPSTAAVEIDTNTIPSMLIESVDLITGGASAAYGSDAISGVINFRLRSTFAGIQIRGQSSITQLGDGGNREWEAVAGTGFADGHGHAVLALSYHDRQAVPRRARAFYRASYAVGGGSASGTLPLGAFQPNSSNLPSQAALTQLFAGYGVTATIAPASVLGFNPDGSLFTQNGTVRNYRGPGIQAGYGINPTGSLVYDPNTEDGLMAPMKKGSLFARIGYDLSDRLAFYAQGYATRYRNVSLASASLAIVNNRLMIPVTNPFIPDDLKAILASRPDPTADFAVTKRFSANGGRTIEHDFDVFQILGGAKGKLRGDRLAWDIYALYGATHTVDRLANSNMIGTLLAQLLRAPDGGTSLCEGGLNPFIDQAISPDCIAFTSRDVVSHTRLRQTVLDANLQGELLALPAGPLSFAVGISYRRNSYDYAPDPILYPGPTPLLAFLSTVPTSGTTTVKEVNGELLVPLLKDRIFATSLTLNLAARYSHYNPTGGVSAYKAEVQWAPLAHLSLRSAWQRAVRAPNVGELFSGAVSVTNALGSPTTGGGDPCDVRTVYRKGADAAAIRDICLAQGVPSAAIDFYTMEFNQFTSSRAGNTSVRSEKANSFTAGGAFTSSSTSLWLRSLSVSVDYYNIEVARAIGSIAAPQALTNCYNRARNPGLDPENAYCQAIVRSADGTIQLVDTPYRNLGAYHTSGIDTQLNWTVPFEAMGAAPTLGGLTVELMLSYVRSFDMQATPDQAFLHYAGTIDTSGQVQPRWRSLASLAYAGQRITLGLRWRHLSGMDDVTRETAPDNERPGVPAYDIFDLFCQWRVQPGVALRAGVDNLADRPPPVVGGVAGTTDLGTYDGLGRRVYLGFKVKL